MKRKLKKGITYVLMGGFLLAVSALVLLAVSRVGHFYRPMQTPWLERLGLLGIALVVLALAAILFAFVFRHPRRLLAVSLLGILAFVILNVVSGRHVLPELLIWPSPQTLSERYIQALAAGDLEAARRLTHPSHECHQIMTQQFVDDRAQLVERLGDGWSESGLRYSIAKQPATANDDQMPQQLVHIQVQTEAGQTVGLTLRMRYKTLRGARFICGTGVPTGTTGSTSETASTETTPAPTEESANEQTFGEACQQWGLLGRRPNERSSL